MLGQLIAHLSDNPKRPPQAGVDLDHGPTFLGKLEIIHARRRPWLCITIFCSHCGRRRPHHHTWGIDPEPTEPTHRAAHCTKPNSPFHRSLGEGEYYGYFVFPEPTEANSRVVEEFREYRLKGTQADDDRRARLLELLARPARGSVLALKAESERGKEMGC